MKRNHFEKGFTLIELMIVMIILSTLAAMIVPRFTGRSEESKKSVAKADVEGNIGNALDLYELDNGIYPATDQGLMALVDVPSSPPVPRNWRGPYVKKKEFKDPWGNPYQYRSPGTVNKDYDLFSYGPDGAQGGSDDIGNWSGDDHTGK